MNQGKLEMVKQEMARLNINILGISELNGLEWANLTQMTIIYLLLGARIPQKKWSRTHNQQESKMQHVGATSEITE